MTRFIARLSAGYGRYCIGATLFGVAGLAVGSIAEMTLLGPAPRIVMAGFRVFHYHPIEGFSEMPGCEPLA
ncbi:hypothetical protein RAD15_40500 [Bradyrhizobium sp. 14AA]